MSSEPVEQDAYPLYPDDPVEAVFIECVKIYRERAKKYTDENWDDNFQYIAQSMRDLGLKQFQASDAAAVLKAVKDARIKAGISSGRKEFADDSFRDSLIDKINYSAIELALKDKEERMKQETSESFKKAIREAEHHSSTATFTGVGMAGDGAAWGREKGDNGVN